MSTARPPIRAPAVSGPYHLRPAFVTLFSSMNFLTPVAKYSTTPSAYSRKELPSGASSIPSRVQNIAWNRGTTSCLTCTQRRLNFTCARNANVCGRPRSYRLSSARGTRSKMAVPGGIFQLHAQPALQSQLARNRGWQEAQPPAQMSRPQCS